MEKDYLAEYVIGRIYELEAKLAETRKERDKYLGELTWAREDAKAVFNKLEHNTLSDGSGDRYYKLAVWDKPNRPYAALKHLLWLLGVADPGALVKENEEKE